MSHNSRQRPSTREDVQNGKAKATIARTFEADPLPSTTHQHATAVSLIDKMKNAASDEGKIALLSQAAKDPMALAWIAILYKENGTVGVKAVDMIGSDIPALKEICWRCPNYEQKEVRAAAVSKLACLLESTDDKDVPSLVALHSPDPSRRELAVKRMIGSGDALTICSCATCSGFDDTQKSLLRELVRIKDPANIRSVALFCGSEAISQEAIAALARLDDFDSLMIVFSHSSLPKNRIHAIEAAAASGSERMLRYHDTHGSSYVLLSNHPEQILSAVHDPPKDLAALRYHLDESSFKFALTALAVLSDKSWDPGHARDTKLRGNRLIYRMTRVHPDFEEDDWNPMIGFEINDLLRGKLGLNTEQTADIEWKPDAKAGKPADRVARPRL